MQIMMDRTTGKTLSDAYVEFTSISDMRRAIEARNQKPLKGRIVSVTECSQEELLTVVFPKWRGQFHGTLAIPPASEIVRTMSTAAGGGNSGCPPFITREEINSLLVVCKNYKVLCNTPPPFFFTRLTNIYSYTSLENVRKDRLKISLV